jgi:hypothetical protein
VGARLQRVNLLLARVSSTSLLTLNRHPPFGRREGRFARMAEQGGTPLGRSVLSLARRILAQDRPNKKNTAFWGASAEANAVDALVRLRRS